MKSTPLVDIALALVARTVPGLLSLLAVPFYVRTLGPESYAAVGFFMTIQMLVGLLDFGLSTAVLREASWLTGQEDAPAGRLRTLLRTFVVPFWIAAGTITAIGVVGGDFVLRNIFSIDPARIGAGFPASAFLFASVGCRFPFSVYFAYLSGRGYVARANMIVLVMDSLRTIGTVLLLLLAPSLITFFGWQAIVSITISVLGLWMAHRSSPPVSGPYALDWSLYSDLRNLTVGMGLFYVLHSFAYHWDKIILFRFISTTDYGFYVALGQLAVIPFWVPHAVWGAQHPRVLLALAAGNTRNAVESFGLTASLMSAMCSAFALAVYLAAPALVRLWIQTPDSDRFAEVLVALTVGNVACGLSHLALSIQHAAKTMVPLVVVFVIAIVIVPLGVLLFAGTLTLLSGAIVWCGVYVALFIGGGASFIKHGRPFIGTWGYRVVLPFILTVVAGSLLSPWTRELSDSAQITVGAVAGTLAFVANLAVQSRIRTGLWNLVFAAEPVSR